MTIETVHRLNSTQSLPANIPIINCLTPIKKGGTLNEARVPSFPRIQLVEAFDLRMTDPFDNALLAMNTASIRQALNPVPPGDTMARSNTCSLNCAVYLLGTDGVFDAFFVFIVDPGFRDDSLNRVPAKHDARAEAVRIAIYSHSNLSPST